MIEDVIRTLFDHKRRIGSLEVIEVAGVGTGLRTIVATDDVSDPPTDAELDAAFGTPATVGEGFMGFLDDNNAESKIWFCVAIGSTWWYEELTKAV